MLYNVDLDTVFKGPFNNYVDKMRGWVGGGGQNMSVFVHAQGIKTGYAGRGVRGWWGVKKWQNSVP